MLSERSAFEAYLNFWSTLWVVLGICVGAAIVLVLFLISLWFTSRRNNLSKLKSLQSPTIPNVSKEIQEIRIDHFREATHPQPDRKSSHATNPDPLPESETLDRAQAMHLQQEDETPGTGRQRIHFEIGKDHRISYPEKCGGSSHGSRETMPGEPSLIAIPEFPI